MAALLKTLSEIRQIENRLDQRHLDDGDWVLFKAYISNLILKEESKIARAAQKALNLAQLGEEGNSDPEQTGDTVLTPSPSQTENDPDPRADPIQNSNHQDEPSKSKAPGHGRNGACAFTNADHETHPIKDTVCAHCKKGRISNEREKVVVRIVGQPLFKPELHHIEQGKCLNCGKNVSGDAPPEIYDGIGKAVIYHWSACSMLLVIHYTEGMPFKRLESLHQSWGIPFSDSNQWEVVSQSTDYLLPLYKALEQHGIQSVVCFRIDDTGSMVIEIHREIISEVEAAKALGLSPDSIRTGINATCARIDTLKGTVILFYTGRHHAGEIIDQLFQNREIQGTKIIKATDGASKNFSHGQSKKMVEITCNAHAFLKFQIIKDQFPADYAIVGEAYHHVFEHDAKTKENGMTPEERLAFHQKHSKPWMEKIKEYCTSKIQSRLVEPRSPLWEPLNFIINQWSRLTQFLKVAGAPLDTNLVEQSLIIPVRYLARSFNYQTANGAEVGDMAMSLIATARANEVEPVAYLTHCLANHHDLKLHPEKYLPWNYRERLEATGRSPPYPS